MGYGGSSGSVRPRRRRVARRPGRYGARARDAPCLHSRTVTITLQRVDATALRFINSFTVLLLYLLNMEIFN